MDNCLFIKSFSFLDVTSSKPGNSNFPFILGKRRSSTIVCCVNDWMKKLKLESKRVTEQGWAINNFIFSIPERFLKILLTYFSAGICTLILSNWQLPNLCGLLAEKTAVIRKLWHSVASLMGTSKVYNCPFVRTT